MIKVALEDLEDRVTLSRSREGTPVSQVPLGKKSPFKKLDPPKFSGKIGDFPYFRKLFEELTEGVPHSSVVILENLKSCLPSDAVELIRECESVGEAWPVLERLYGDRETSILHVIRNLGNTDISRGPDHERIEKLGQAIQKAVKLLHRLNATNAISRDFELVEQLVAKLPQSVQWEWSRHLARVKRTSNQSKWEMFQTWIEELREAALESKLRALANGSVTSTQNPTSKPGARQSIPKPSPVTNNNQRNLQPACYRCGKLGHIARNCPDPASFHSINTVREVFEVNTMADQFLNTAYREKAYKRAEERFGKCPVCHTFHTYERKIAGEKHQ